MLSWSRGSKEEEPSVAATNPTTSAAPSAAHSLSQLLLTEGKVTREQIEAAMAKQKESGRFIGEILIEDKVIEENTLISFLAKHCKIPHLSLLDYLIDKDIVALIPKETCLRYRLIPIDRLGKNLTVAMVNPLDTEALKQVQAVCPELRIKPILCAYRHFELVTEKLFREAERGDGRPVMSASSFGLRLTPEEKARVETKREEVRAAEAVEVAAAAAEAASAELAAAELAAATPTYEPPPMPEPEPPVFETPAPEPTPTPMEEVSQQKPVEPHVDSDSMFESIFSSGTDEPSVAPAEPTPVSDDGGMSSLMQEMATVMMDSMRDTYGVLARRMDLFRNLDGEAVAKIFARGITEEFEAGQTIFDKGSEGDCLYLVLGGSIEIFDDSRVVATLERGALFGEMALISKEPRSASARALESSSLLALSQETIYNVMPREVSIQLLVNIIVTLSSRLRMANEQR